MESLKGPSGYDENSPAYIPAYTVFGMINSTSGARPIVVFLRSIAVPMCNDITGAIRVSFPP